MSCRAMRRRAAVRITAARRTPPDPTHGLSGPTIELPQGTPLRLVDRRAGFALVSAHMPGDPETHVYAWVPEWSVMEGPPSDGEHEKRELATVGARSREASSERAASA